MPAEKINIKTANGSVSILRKKDKATITEERQCFGFKEKVITTVTKLDDTCMHFVFSHEKNIREIFINN